MLKGASEVGERKTKINIFEKYYLKYEIIFLGFFIIYNSLKYLKDFASLNILYEEKMRPEKNPRNEYFISYSKN
jgi:hypothetical protein